MYADKKMNARESDIIPGDLVLQRREKTGKTDNISFTPESFQVAEETGSKVTVESPRATYSRNTFHAKKVLAQKEGEEVAQASLQNQTLHWK